MIFKLQSALTGLLKKFHLDYLVVLVLAFIIFSSSLGNYTLPEPDSFYHAKIAEFLSEGKILHQFPWLQETYLKEVFVDHHFLYHLLLVPFVSLDDPLVGVKMATIIFSSLTVLVIYWFLKRWQVKWPLLYIIILLVSRNWLWRASLVKAPTLFLLFLVLAYFFMSQKKWLDLGLISFLAVWLYGGWPTLLVMSVCFFLSHWLLAVLNKEGKLKEKIKGIFKLKEKLPWQAVVVTFGGLAAGIVINPYFPENLKFYWVQIFKIALVNYQEVVRVGSEWYPFGFYNQITYNSLIMALFIIGMLLLIFTIKKQSVHSLTWGLLAVGFFILTQKSARNIEFFIPLTIIFFALCFKDFYQAYLAGRIKEIANQGSLLLFIVILVFSLTYLFRLPQELFTLRRDILVGFPIDRYKEASLWLKENTPEKSIVFHSDWDDFPILFYYNDHNYYLTGLDHTFMYEFNRQNYELYEDIIRGKVDENLDQKIKENFNASYVFLEKFLIKFDENLSANEKFQEVYEDNIVKIYKVL